MKHETDFRASSALNSPDALRRRKFVRRFRTIDVASVENLFLDSGLTAAQASIANICICSSEPTTFASATTTALLGSFAAGAGTTSSGPSAGTSPTGRKLVFASIASGTITTTGTASWWAAVGTASLYAHGLLSAAQGVTAGNTFSLGSFEVRIANQ